MYIDMFSPDASTAAWLSTFAQSQLDYVRYALPPLDVALKQRHRGFFLEVITRR